MTFDELYARHAACVLHYMMRRGVPPQDAEELCQQVFLIAFRKLDSFEGRSSARTWLCAIGRGLLSNYWRRERRLKSSALAEHAAELGSPTSDGTFESITDTVHNRQLLELLLGQLAQEQRKAFVLAHGAQMRDTEIAAMTGIKADTVRARRRAAVKVLRRAYLRLMGHEQAGPHKVHAQASGPVSRSPIKMSA